MRVAGDGRQRRRRTRAGSTMASSPAAAAVAGLGAWKWGPNLGARFVATCRRGFVSFCPITTLMLSRLSLPPDHNLEGVGLLNLCMWRNTDSRWACRLRSAGLVHGSSFYKTWSPIETRISFPNFGILRCFAGALDIFIFLTKQDRAAQFHIAFNISAHCFMLLFNILPPVYKAYTYIKIQTLSSLTNNLTIKFLFL